MLSREEFHARRKKLAEKMGSKSIAIIAAAPEAIRNGDVHYAYRQNSDFYYLTGFPEPQAIAVITAKKFILFNRSRDINSEIWDGDRAGQQGAVHDFGADESFPYVEFKSRLPHLLQGVQQVYSCLDPASVQDENIKTCLDKVLNEKSPKMEYQNLRKISAELRLFKSDVEIELMRRAAQISVNAHQRAMKICRPGKFEYVLEAEIVAEFCRQGSRAPAYPSIVAGGEKSCTLHYIQNNRILNDGDLVLVDAGCEFDYYASDITRTFPVNGKFSKEQRAIYELVLKIQDKLIAAIRPGVLWYDLQILSSRLLTEGLLELGVLKGDLEKLIQQKAYHDFYMHGFGHWLGMDVHDVGSYKAAGKWRALEPRMALTVEPGIYIRPSDHIEKCWWNIGIRIEDDVVVTKDGCEVLSQGLIKKVEDIEAFMADKAHG